MTGFVEVGPGVYVLRYPVLDVNITLITGDGAALLVDTLSTDAQARELAEAARRVTADPWTIVNTHHHFDHCFGNAVLAAAGAAGTASQENPAGPGRAAIWGHEEAAAVLAGRGEALRRQWVTEWEATDPELAAGMARARLLPPDHTVHRTATLTVGGREVVLRHLGRGHTAGDLVVRIPDADVLVAGDLVEESGPPSFEDSYPLAWPETLAAMLPLTGPATAVVPGHGAVVGRDFVAAQHDALAALAWLIRAGEADRAPAEAIAARASLPAGPALTAVRRGYAELTGSDGRFHARSRPGAP